MTTRWATARLGEVLAQDTEYITRLEAREYPKLSVKLYGRGVVLDAPTNGASLKMSRHQLAKPSQVILSEIWGKKGAIGIVPPEGDGALCTSHFFLFDVVNQRMDARYLAWIFRANFLEHQLNVEARGTTGYAAVRPKHLLNCEIPLPPLAEQRRIVARIDELAATIREGRSLRRRSDEEGREVAVSQASRALERLVRDYGRREFGSFGPHVTSGPRDWAKCYERSGLRFYRAQDIGPEGRVVEDSKVFISPPPGQQGRSAMLQVGDLMMVITGATVGRCAVFEPDLEQGFVSQHVAICRLPQEAIDPKFVLWGLRTRQGQDQLLGQRYGQGKPGLNLRNVRALTLPFPPLSEQQRVVRELDELESETMRLRKLQAESTAALDALMPAVLDRAFRGEL